MCKKRINLLSGLLCASLAAGLLVGCASSTVSKSAGEGKDNGFLLTKESSYSSNTGSTREVFYDYDDTNRVIREVERTDHNCAIKCYEYTSEGKKRTPLIEQYSDGIISNRMEYVYDENGNLDSQRVTYFDGYGNQKSLSVYDITLDEHGNTTESVLYSGKDDTSLEFKSRSTTRWTYEEDGTEVSVDYVDGTIYSRSKKLKDEEGKVLLYECKEEDGDYTYKECEYVNGELAHQIYISNINSNSRLEKSEVIARFDERGRCQYFESLSDGAVPGDGTYYVYDEAGNKAQEATLHEGRVASATSYVYDQYGNLLTKWAVAYSSNGAPSDVKRTTYEYISEDGSLRVSGSEYDGRKYLAAYADNHPITKQLLVDFDSIYEQYGSQDCEGGLGIDYEYIGDNENLYAFDESIKCTQKTSETLKIVTDSYECELPASWAKDVEVDYEGPLQNDCALVYRSSFSKEPYRLLTISYSEANPDMPSDAGDVGMPLTASFEKEGYSTHLDVFAVSYPYRFWYQDHSGYQTGINGLDDAEKQYVLNLLYDDNADLKEIVSVEDLDVTPYIDFENYSWLQTMKTSMVIKQ